MDFRIFIEPQQGASYADQLRIAQESERLGFDGFFRSDHYLAMGGSDGLPGPTDAWTTLAGIARETERINLGTLMTAATFRLPGILAIQAAQVDEMSGGRLELGLGAGWFEAEHRAYGIPFPPHRFDLLTEQLEIISGLWSTPSGETFSYDGAHYQLVDSPALPKPGRDIPVIIGGHGPRRTPALAARFANEFNTPFAPVERVRPLFDGVRAAAEEIGRDPDDLTYSSAFVVCIGADEDEFTRRAQAIGREPAELRQNGVAGTPAQAIERLQELGSLGVERTYLQFLDLSDLEHLGLIAQEVVPHV